MFKATPFKLWGNLCWKGALGRAMFLYVCVFECICIGGKYFYVHRSLLLFFFCFLCFCYIIFYFYFQFHSFYIFFRVNFFSLLLFILAILWWCFFFLHVIEICGMPFYTEVYVCVHICICVYMYVFYISSGSSSILNTFSRYYCFFSSFFSFIFNINIL